MSYILDALKKPEQERGHGTAPTVQTLHSAGLGHPVARQHMWPYLLLAAIAVNLAALVYFMITGSATEQAEQPQNISVAPEQLAYSAAATDDASEITASLAMDPVDEVEYKPVMMPAVTQTRTATPETRPRVVSAAAEQAPDQGLAVLQRDELPLDVRQHIPAMEFSAHVYSSNPQHRSIVINGRFMEEGDMLASDLQLSEITPRGAIFEFQGQRFHQSVVSAWN